MADMKGSGLSAGSVCVVKVFCEDMASLPAISLDRTLK